MYNAFTKALGFLSTSFFLRRAGDVGSGELIGVRAFSSILVTHAGAVTSVSTYIEREVAFWGGLAYD